MSGAASQETVDPDHAAPAAAGARMGSAGPSRRGVVLTTLISSALLAAGTRLVWVNAMAADATGTQIDVPVLGAAAAPAALALGFVGIAGALALMLSSRLIRLITGSVLVLAGLGATAAVLLAAAAPVEAARSAVISTTGLIGAEVTARATPWPWLCAAPALLIAVSGVLVLLRGHHWAGRSRRFVRDTDAEVDPEDDPAAAWDALSRGEDPSDRSGR